MTTTFGAASCPAAPWEPPLDRERGGSPLHYDVALPHQEGLCSV